MKQLTTLVLALFFATTLTAQVGNDWQDKMRKEQEKTMNSYEEFKQQALQDYENFRKKANDEYAKFMKEAWKRYYTQPAEEPPAKPKPPVPFVDQTKSTTTPKPRTDNNTTSPIRVPDPVVIDVIPQPKYNLEIRPEPLEPIIPSTPPMIPAQSVSLYGSDFSFHLYNDDLPMLKDASENSVANMWQNLSEPKFDHLILECLAQRDSRNLCDWAYVQLTQQVAEKQYGKDTNEAKVMQMYLLTQSGYQMRIGRSEDNKLLLLIGTKEKIFRYHFFEIGDSRFYILDPEFKKQDMNIFDHAFPKERSLTLALSQPDLVVEKTEQRTITSKRYPEVSITVQTNKNLIDFYNDYPLNSNWQYYSLASLSSVVKDSLYPALRKAIEGRTDLQAANVLINFVQTGFQYQTDNVQFGYERPLFPDETFYYPYSDCEDRSILFSCLVRELLGLDVVLLDYPDHIATAICFNEPVNGDYIVVDDKNYIISDPTYLNAKVGMCAPVFQTVTPKVIKF